MKKFGFLLLVMMSTASFAQTAVKATGQPTSSTSNPTSKTQASSDSEQDADQNTEVVTTPSSTTTSKTAASTTTASTAGTTQSAEMSSAALVSKATNPLAPLSVFVLQNFVQTGLGAGNSVGDEVLARYVQHIPANKIIPVQQLIRVQVPFNAVPSLNGQSVQAGLSGASLFDAFLFKLDKSFEIGIGPSFTLPTSTFTTPFTGPNVTQGGASLVTVYRKPRLTISTSTQVESAFKWQNGQPNIATISFEPSILYTIYGTWYIRSTATWTFSYQPGGNNQYNIPIGLGLGKVWKTKGLIYNFYIEPQPTVAKGGIQSQNFQLLAGMNILFNKG